MCVSVSVYVCACVCVCVCYVCVCVCMHVCTRLYVCLHTCACVCVWGFHYSMKSPETLSNAPHHSNRSWRSLQAQNSLISGNPCGESHLQSREGPQEQVARRSAHLGQVVLIQSCCCARGEGPRPVNLSIGGSSTGNWSYGTATA